MRSRVLRYGVLAVALIAGCGDNNKGQPVEDAPPAQVTLGGTVEGLVGSGLVLQNNGGADLEITADGAFTFAGTIAEGSAYAVTVLSNPTSPAQTCTVANGSGTAGATAITDIVVTCATDLFTVSGTVTGLVGTGLVLENNLTDALTITSDGAFTFATSIASGSAFAVTVKTQPTGPVQTCSVSGGTGTIGASNVDTVVVDCSTNRFTIGGIVSGLDGTVVLQNNGGDDISVTSNGSFAFPTTVESGASYAVTVLTQPGAPSQTCVVSSGSGTVVDLDITSIRVDCTTNTFTVGGTVTGLAGTGLVLQNNAGDNLAITADGTFTFATPIASGTTYDVTVLSQPEQPTQVCTVSAGSGTVGGAAVTDVTVTCATSSFTIGGSVSGLAGTGLVLTNNGGDDLAITADGTFTFSMPVQSGGTYAVAVKTQPTGPSQTCTISGGTGDVVASNVTSVTVNCDTDRFTVGGTIAGLAGQVVLQNNGGDDLTVSANGSFAFATTVASGGTYAVTVSAQPGQPAQTCVVTAGTGTVTTSDITTVRVDCTTNRYRIGAAVTGLDGTGLVLQNNGGNNLPVTANGTSYFTTTIESGGTYDVSVLTNPSNKSQTCVVTNGAGSVTNADVVVTVTCTTNTYRIGGSVSGLAGTGLVLRNGAENLSVSANGTFQFATPVASGGTYAVTVVGQPTSPWQTCSVTNGSGSVTNANITNVVVTCTTNTYKLGGSVSGLLGTGLTLRNGTENLAITANGDFAFVGRIASGQSYAVSIVGQPTNPTQSCTIAGETGTVNGADVTSVVVNCTTNTYTVGGTISGLAGTVVLTNNGGDNLTLTANGDFAFQTPVASGQTYAVAVLTQPGSPAQTCTVTSGSGTVTNAPISDVTVTCETNRYTVGGTLQGLAAGATVVLRNNNTDELARNVNGAFEFATPIPSGSMYAVTVFTQPANQQCSVTNGSGTVTNAAITNIVVTCVNIFTLTVTKTGDGLVQSSPGGIDCGTDCSETYPGGTQVTLLATAGASSSFTSWSGAPGCTTATTCVVTMDQARSVTATFTFRNFLMDSAPTQDSYSFTDQRCNGSISLAIAATTATTITGLESYLNPTTATRVKFAIFNQATSALVFQSAVVNVGAGLQFVASPAMNFVMTPGTRYHFAAMVEGCAYFPWDLTAATANGLQTFANNGNPTSFASPTGPYQCCSVDPRFKIYGTHP